MSIGLHEQDRVVAGAVLEGWRRLGRAGRVGHPRVITLLEAVPPS